MASFNRVILLGNLTRDPELKYTPQGQAVCEFGLALNERYKNKQTGQDVEKVHFIDITCWGRTAEVAAEYLKKGSQVHIEGKLQQDRWEDAQGGKRSKVKVTCEQLTFVGGKKDSDSQSAPAGGASAGVGAEEDVPF